MKSSSLRESQLVALAALVETPHRHRHHRSFAPNNAVLHAISIYTTTTTTTRPRRLCSTKAQLDEEAERLFYGEAVPMSELGLHPDLIKALSMTGKTISTTIQSSAIPLILDGLDVVMGAETGSGKTLAYLLPIFHKILSARDLASDSLALAGAKEINAKDAQHDFHDESHHHHHRADNEEAEVGRAQQHQREQGPLKPLLWQKYPKAIVLTPNRDLCEQAARMASEISQKLSDLAPSPDREIRVVAAYGSERDWPFRPRLPCPDVLVCTPKMLRQHVRDLELFSVVETLVIDEADMLLDRGGYQNDINEILVGFKRANRTIKDNQKTQTILSAATIPTMGLKSVEKFIKKRFPSAVDVRADLMHKHHPATIQEFIKTGTDFEDKVAKVTSYLKANLNEYPKTIVFANSAADAQRLSEALMDRLQSPDMVFPYHKDVPSYERDTVIAGFREASQGVLVCTDLGARGLDIPDVRHVIQAQFATNVVQHLHRIGRATRAGRSGRATNFYDDRNQDLLDAITDAGEKSLDHSFSRRRGFRKTVRRYGKKFYKERSKGDPENRKEGRQK